jgi:hypothetical protein
VLDHEARYPNNRVDEIREEKATEQAAKEAARFAADSAPRFAVQALVVGSEDNAIDTLQAVIDSGFDGTVISNESAGSSFFELRIGPYETVAEAKQVADFVERAHSLNPAVVILTPKEDSNAP